MRLFYKLCLISTCIFYGNAYTQPTQSEDLNTVSLSLKTAMNSGDSLQVARECLTLGKIYSWQGKYDQSYIYLTRALQISVQTGDTALEKAILDRLALTYTFLGNYPEAINCIDKSIKLAEATGNQYEVAKAEVNFGMIYKHQGNFTKALEIFIRAQPIIKQNEKNENMLIAVDNCIGGIYFHKKDYTESLRYLNSALATSRKLGVMPRVAENLAMIGLVYRGQHRYSEALQNEFQALNIYSEIGDKEGIATTGIEIGDTYKAIGEMQKALESYTKSLNICDEISDNESKAISLYDIGDIMIQQAAYSDPVTAGIKYDKATASLKESLDMSLLMDQKEQIMNIYKSLFLIDSAKGDFNNALKNYKLYTQYKDSLLTIESTNQVERLQYQFDREQKKNEINLLTRENEIKSLEVQNQKAALLSSKMEAARKQDQILLLASSRELQKLQLEKTLKDLERKNKEFKDQKEELESTRQIRDLREREVRSQKMQRNGILFTSGVILIAGILFIRSLRLRKKMEKHEAVAKERERISADLHDDIGSGLSKIILMLEVLNREAGSAEVKNKFRAISEESLALSHNMSEVIWALNARNDYLESLVAYIHKYASGYFENSTIRFKMNAPSHLPQQHLSSEQRRNIFYVVKEALHNIVKHAGATEAELTITCEDQIISIIIRDNGKGLPDGDLNRFGNGIIQMRNRLKNINGDFSIKNGIGTTIELSLPV